MAIVIYSLMCKVNGVAYIGSTKGKPSKRLREHRCLLRSGKHKCEGLQSDWALYGESQFIICTLETLGANASLDSRREAELRWMAKFEESGRLYNVHIVSMSPTYDAIMKGVAHAHDEPGNRWTPEANLKRSLAQKGKPKGHGAKISATKRANREMKLLAAEIAERLG